jgi:uncharacterized protein
VIALLDVNVLIALAWPEHVFHAVVVQWFDQRADQGWATCSITESGFIRVSANAKVVGAPVRPSEAAELLRQLQMVGSHTFWVDDVAPSQSPLMPLDRLTGNKHVADAHLLALSRRHQGSIATLDRAVITLARGLPDTCVEYLGDR